MRNAEDKIVFLKSEPFDTFIISRIKEIPGRFWNSETKLWEIPAEKAHYKMLKSRFGDIVCGNPEYYLLSLIHELKSRNYSRRTFSNYVSTVKHFLEKTGSKPERISPEEIEHYLINLQESGLAPKTVNLHASALLFFYTNVLGNQIFSKMFPV